MAFAFPPGCTKDRDRAVFAAAVKRALIAYHNKQHDPARREWALKALQIVGYWWSRYAQKLGAQTVGAESTVDSIKAEAVTQSKFAITDTMLEKIDYWADRAATLG